MISGDRLRQIRELRGLTQSQLAKDIGTVQPTLARAEAGTRDLDDALVRSAALRLGFPVRFFRRPSGPQFPLGSLLFRARTSVTARERNEAFRYAQTAYEVAAELSKRLQTVPVRLPQGTSPIDAAHLSRSAFGLAPDRPVPNLTHAAEQAGVMVIALPVRMHGRDAFSAWVGGDQPTPCIFTTVGLPGDRVRFSVAHELGHLVLHRSPVTDPKTLEAEADAFAAELLMPERAMRETLVPPITLELLSHLKPRWAVSIAALIRRAHDLELITDRTYRYLFEQVGARGWRTREPAEFRVPLEKPRSLRRMAELLYGNPIDEHRLAVDLGLPLDFARDLLRVQATANELVPVVRERARRHHLITLPGGSRLERRARA